MFDHLTHAHTLNPILISISVYMVEAQARTALPRNIFSGDGRPLLFDRTAIRRRQGATSQPKDIR